MPEAVFQHTIGYPDNNGITLSEIAATLIAQEKLIPLALETIEKIYPGLYVENIRVNLDYARHGSLTESFFVAILIVFQKDLDRAVPDLFEHLTGIHIPEAYRSLVTVLFIMLMFYGAKILGAKLSKQRDDQHSPTTIGTQYNTFLNIAAERIGATPEQLGSAIESTITPKRKGLLTRAVIDMFRPAKRGTPGRIVSPGLPEISREAVAEFPDAATLVALEDGTEVEAYGNAVLEVRATDRDKGSRGWAGKLHVGSMSTKRLNIKLYPTVDREALALLPQARVEALIETRRLDDDTTKPLCIHVVRLLSDSPNGEP